MSAKKDSIDLFGASTLLVLMIILALNQVVIKVGNDGFSPVFGAGLRSIIGFLIVFTWMRVRGFELELPRTTWPAMTVFASLFTVEFIFLFIALDYTTVVRVSVIFYSMPVWMALIGHFVLPGDRVTIVKALGLAIAFGGVVVALTARGDALAGGSLIGDLLALAAAFCWAGIVLCAKGTNVSLLRPEMQLMTQLLVSGIILTAISPLFGPLIRELAPIHFAAIGFQALFVASGGFLFFLYLLKVYPASSVASFSFLTPVFGVWFGWALLDEPISFAVFAALIMVAVGLIFINKPARKT